MIWLYIGSCLLSAIGGGALGAYLAYSAYLSERDEQEKTVWGE